MTSAQQAVVKSAAREHRDRPAPARAMRFTIVSQHICRTSSVWGAAGGLGLGGDSEQVVSPAARVRHGGLGDGVMSRAGGPRRPGGVPGPSRQGWGQEIVIV